MEVCLPRQLLLATRVTLPHHYLWGFGTKGVPTAAQQEGVQVQPETNKLIMDQAVADHALLGGVFDQLQGWHIEHLSARV